MNLPNTKSAEVRKLITGEHGSVIETFLHEYAALLASIETPVEAVDKWVADYHEGEQDNIVVLAKNLAAQLESERDRIEAATVERCAAWVEENAEPVNNGGDYARLIRSLAKKGKVTG